MSVLKVIPETRCAHLFWYILYTFSLQYNVAGDGKVAVQASILFDSECNHCQPSYPPKCRKQIFQMSAFYIKGSNSSLRPIYLLWLLAMDGGHIVNFTAFVVANHLICLTLTIRIFLPSPVPPMILFSDKIDCPEGPTPSSFSKPANIASI